MKKRSKRWKFVSLLLAGTMLLCGCAQEQKTIVDDSAADGSGERGRPFRLNRITMRWQSGNCPERRQKRIHGQQTMSPISIMTVIIPMLRMPCFRLG